MVLEEIRDRRTRQFSKDELELGIPRSTDEPPTVKLYFDPGKSLAVALMTPRSVQNSLGGLRGSITLFPS